MTDRRSFLKLTAAAPAVGLAAGEQTGCISSRAQTPPLGWNSFDSYGVYLHEKAAHANLDAMAKKLKPAGYEYFVVDNGWFGEYKLVPGTMYPAEKHASDIHVNEYGLFQPSKTYFPNGLKPLIDKAHRLGLKFGVHLMRGIPRKAVELNLPVQGTKYTARDIANTDSICKWCHYNYGVDMTKPGAQAFYNSLINQLAGWGIDFIKADDLVPFPDEIVGYANAIEQTGRDIAFSLSPGGKWKKSDLPYYRRGNMLRITADIWDRREDVEKGFDAWRDFQGTDYPGFWPDLDMIPFGQLLMMSPKEHAGEGSVALAGKGYKRACQLTKPQMRSFLTQRAMAASPLVVGGDLPTLDDFSLSLLTNKQMLACNQNGVMGANTYRQDDFEVWLTPDRMQPGRGWLGIFNRSESGRSVRFSIGQLGVEATPHQMHDIWWDKPVQWTKAGATFELEADDVAFLTFRKTAG
jgi:melibiase-like protein